MSATTTTGSVYGKAFRGNAPENYERYFVPGIGRPFGLDLVAQAGLRPGQRVLDVACGTGIVTRLAAERVGSTGSVAGVDIHAAMLEVARRVVQPSAAIRWYETSAEAMPFPDESFDVALCQFGLQFISDKKAALREIRRVLVPGGRVWTSLPTPTTFVSIMHDAVKRHVDAASAGFIAMVFSLNDPESIRGLFESVGFREVAVRIEAKTLRLPGPQQFLRQYLDSTPLLPVIDSLEASRSAALEQEVTSGWQPWVVPGGGLEYEQRIVVVSATR